MKPGIRVAAILSASKTEVQWLGEGVYEGDFVPDSEAAGPFAELDRQVELANPRIRLDSGQIVWGCECWWGPVEEIRRSIAGRTLVLVDIEEARRKCKEGSGE